MHFWSFWAKYCHFWHILSNARPKNNANKVPRWLFRYVDIIWTEIGIFCYFGPGLASSSSDLLVGWLVDVACGLYLARHLSMTMPGHERTGIKLKFINTPSCHRATSFNLVILCLFSFSKDFLFFQNNVVELYPRLI